MPANVDWGQVVFLVLVVVVGFVRWVAGLIEQHKLAKQRESLTPEEIEQERLAWQRYLENKRRVEEEEAAREAAIIEEQLEEERRRGEQRPVLPDYQLDPFEALKRLLDPTPEPAPRAAPTVRRQPHTPPPLPTPQPPPLVPASVAASQAIWNRPDVSRAFPVSNQITRSMTAVGARHDQRTSEKLSLLRKQLATPQALRQAILAREVLGPPVALR
jgi:hypothetical protein